MALSIGDRIPAGTLRVMSPEGPSTISVEQLFDGRRVVLFSTPGAFTPKSTLKQVPSYLTLADQIGALGVDEILCVAPNDAHVMAAWADHCRVNGEIRMLADAQAEFFTSLGLEMDCTRFALGYRCQRFSLIAEDRVVTHLNIEQPGVYDVSGAETIVAQLRGAAGSKEQAQ